MRFDIKFRLDVTRGKIPCRFYVCILTFIGLTVNYIMRFIIANALTEMVKAIPSQTDPEGCPPLPSDNKPDEKPTKDLLEWSENEQSLMLSSFFWGYTVMHLPGGIFADYFGPRRVLFVGGLVTSVFTMLTPTAAHCNLWALGVCRIIIGLAQGCFYSSLHTVVALWVPAQERGFWGTIVFSGAPSGHFCQTLCTGYMLATFRPHWEYVFYIWGSIGIVWAILYFFTIYESYEAVPSLTEKERALLDKYYESVSKKRVVHTPWKQILTSKPVWATILGMIGHDWGIFALIVDIPKFMKSYLKFDVIENGTYLSIGYLFLILVAFISGWFVDIIDRKKWMSRSWNRTVFTTVASVGPSIGLLGVSYAACNRVVAVIFLILGMTTMGTFYPSLKINPIDLSPNHAGTVGAVGVAFGAAAGILVPYVIGALTPNSTWKEWNYVWWLTFAVMSITNVVYIVWASGEVQPWNSEGLEKPAEE